MTILITRWAHDAMGKRANKRSYITLVLGEKDASMSTSPGHLPFIYQRFRAYVITEFSSPSNPLQRIPSHDDASSHKGHTMRRRKVCLSKHARRTLPPCHHAMTPLESANSQSILTRLSGRV